MSSNHSDRKLDEQLDRHIAALCDEPIDSGPSEQTIDATLRSLRVACGRRRFIERLAVMSFAQRIAAVVMVTLGALVLYIMFALFNSLAPSVAFADVAQKFKSARTLAYTSTVTIPGHQQPVVTRTLMAEPDRTRHESDRGDISIRIGPKVLILNSKSRTAYRMDLSGAATRSIGEDHSMVKALRSLGEARGEPLGEQTIAGVRARGFRATIGSQTMTVWADAKTAMPVRVETSIPMGAGKGIVVMDKFEIDPPLDDALFSLDPPAGYTVSGQPVNVAIGTPEESVVNLLRFYAQHSGGSFPPRINDPAVYAEMLKPVQAQTQPDPQAMKMAGTLGAGFGAVFSLMSQEGSGYAGEGVKLGQKDKIIFWFKPHGSTKHRAIFGDLRVDDVTQDRLPATQPTQPASK